MSVVLSYGLGVDSTALLLRWLEEPGCRDFPLSELLVVTAMTGDEWPLTGALVEAHVLPRLRDAGVRYAQVARGGRRQAEGIVVLEDSVGAERLHLAGAYRLSEEMTAAGTVPQTGGNRLCSMKFKGWVIDTYLARNAPEATRHAFGYESGEVGRAERCAGRMPGRLAFGFGAAEAGRARRASEYDSAGRRAEFPLIEWGWDRDACRRHIEQVTGVADWPKSACVYCPFALTSRAGRARSLSRFDTRPESALEALMLERRSLCLNPRGGLIAGERLERLIAAERPAIAAAFEERLEAAPHSVYEVRRVWLPRTGEPGKVGTVYRELRVLGTGSRRRCESLLRRRGEVDGADGIARVYRLRAGPTLPRREHFLVAGPAGAEAKARPGFADAWRAAEHEQLVLG
ncbi:MAG TPA: hypothetical protein VHA80_05525 [Solirubrobacterales bacterium]|nr:hypothetical protein [Solirubrobacterales bacterium]